jgi:hypothetical protein
VAATPRQLRIISGKEDGRIILHDSDGQLIEAGDYLAGHKEGMWTHHSIESGVRCAHTGRYVGGKRQGLWVHLRNEQIVTTVEYLDGRRHGTAINYNPSGQAASIIEMACGEMHGYQWFPPSANTATTTDCLGYWCEWHNNDDTANFGIGTPPPEPHARLLRAVKDHAALVNKLFSDGSATADERDTKTIVQSRTRP